MPSHIWPVKSDESTHSRCGGAPGSKPRIGCNEIKQHRQPGSGNHQHCRKGLPGASALDRKVWGDFFANTEQWMSIIENRLETLLGDQKADESAGAGNVSSTDYSGNDVVAVTKCRQGHNLFRDEVFTAYQSCCCISDIADSRLLIASHIKP